MATHWLRPGEFKEVVQIGAVRLDGDFNIVAEFDVLVRPRINSRLSPYFENLTGITNEDVARSGQDFAAAQHSNVGKRRSVAQGVSEGDTFRHGAEVGAFRHRPDSLEHSQIAREEDG